MNDYKKSGDELIALERERQVLEHGHSIVQDARLNKNNQLIQMVYALIEHKYSHAPDDWDKSVVENMMAKPYVERLIYAGALIAAEIDRLNLLKQIDESMQSLNHADQNPENKNSGEEMPNSILPPSCQTGQ